MSLPITFLSDYGNADEFAGVCRAVIARVAPALEVIDLTHAIAPFDIAAGAAALARALPYCPSAVHLAVVDPGVGGARRSLAIAAVEGRHLFVGPDNGLLVAALELCGGAAAAVAIKPPPPGTPVGFDGRDVFAPAAAHLAVARDLQALGDPIDPATIVRLPVVVLRLEPDRIATEVASIDRFGNIALKLSAAELAAHPLGELAELVVCHGDQARRVRRARAFSEVSLGEPLLHADSSGSAAIAINQGRAADHFGAGAGAKVGQPITLEPPR